MRLDAGNLGERLVLAARFAVIAHIQQHEEGSEELLRRALIGGAGLGAVTDDRRADPSTDGEPQ